MEPADRIAAVAAARSVVASLGLPVDDAVVLSDSTKVIVRLLPCDVAARVGLVGEGVIASFQVEIDLALALAAVGGPVAPLDPRVPAVVHVADGFAMTLWSHLDATAAEVAPADIAGSLARLHSSLREIDLAAQHFTDRVGSARSILADPALSPRLGEDDRALLVRSMQEALDAVLDRRAPEQLLHGEPHPGNVIGTADGLLFIDLETCCRGPIAFDLAHVPDDVVARYPHVDPELLASCRHLVLAVVAAWRCEPDDGLPRGQAFLAGLLDALRAGPPWPSLDVVHDALPAP